MSDPAKDDRDDALLRRLYDEPDADGDASAAEVDSYRRMRGVFADYARATEIEPPSRGMDELLAAARSRAPARSAVAPEVPGFWPRLRAWLQPIAAHPALASAAMVIVVAVVGGVLYVKGKANVADQEVASAPPASWSQQDVGAAQAPGPDDEPGVVARLEDGEQTVLQENQTTAPGSGSGMRAATGTGHDKDSGRPLRDKPNVVASDTDDTGGKLKQDVDEFGRPSAGKRDGERDPQPVAVGDGVLVTEGRDRSAGKGADVPSLSVVPPGDTSTITPATGDMKKPVKKPAPPQPRPPESSAETDDGQGTTPTAEPTRPEPPAQKSPGKDGKRGPDLDQLTRQARTAARAGDCGVVKTLGSKIRSANATYYKQTFAADPDIKKCL